MPDCANLRKCSVPSVAHFGEALFYPGAAPPSRRVPFFGRLGIAQLGHRRVSSAPSVVPNLSTAETRLYEGSHMPRSRRPGASGTVGGAGAAPTSRDRAAQGRGQIALKSPVSRSGGRKPYAVLRSGIRPTKATPPDTCRVLQEKRPRLTTFSEATLALVGRVIAWTWQRPPSCRASPTGVRRPARRPCIASLP